MIRWLYNSDGDAIAYITRNNVFNLKGDFVGRLYEDNQIWNGEYVGEIFREDRLIFNTNVLHGRRALPGQPGLPGFAGEARSREPVMLPSGYTDIDLC